MENQVRRLVRPRKGMMLAGVSAGIANYLRIDVTIIRIIWVLLLLPGGLPGILPYIILWFIMPSESRLNDNY